MLKKAYRQGALGAMMDEYERAASELRRLVEQIPDDEFVRIVDRKRVTRIAVRFKPSWRTW